MNRCSAPAGTKTDCPSDDRDRLALDGEDAAAAEDDVELVVGVRLLVVGLGRDEHVDADLEAGRGVHDLVPAVPGLETPPTSSISKA